MQLAGLCSSQANVLVSPTSLQLAGLFPSQTNVLVSPTSLQFAGLFSSQANVLVSPTPMQLAGSFSLPLAGLAPVEQTAINRLVHFVGATVFVWKFV